MIQTTADEFFRISILSPILEAADPNDLAVLVDYITDRGEGRLSLDSDVCRLLLAAKQSGVYGQRERNLISSEILEFGGNTLSNAYRKMRNAVPFGGLVDSVLPDANASVPYLEVVRDVASHLKVSVAKNSTVAEMEDGILRKILGNAVDKMTEGERLALMEELGVPNKGITAASLAALIATGRFGGFATYKMAAIVANAVAKALIGRGLAFGAGAAVMRGINIALGPIGWALTALWTLADLASPAYRVTVPCVVQVAYIRRQLIANAMYGTCPGCNEPVQKTDKYCASCGAAQEVIA